MYNAVADVFDDVASALALFVALFLTLNPKTFCLVKHFIFRFDFDSLVGDVWSENDISFFAVIVHYIDQDWI